MTPVDAAFNVHDNSFDDVARRHRGPHGLDHDRREGHVQLPDQRRQRAPSTTPTSPEARRRPQCPQTAAGPGYELDPDADPPLPDATPGPGWAGYCMFTAPGTYTFFCQAHASGMRGTVEVTGGTATPTPTVTATATVTATPTPPAAAARVDAHDSSSPLATGSRSAVPARPTTASRSSAASGSRSRTRRAPTTTTSSSRPGPRRRHARRRRRSPGMPLDPNDAPPLPAFINPPGWEGYCTFPNAGTYTFVCGAHPEMTGTVIVQDATPTPTASPTATATPTVTRRRPPRPPRPARPRRPAATAPPSATASRRNRDGPAGVGHRDAERPSRPAPAARRRPSPPRRSRAATFKRSKRTVTVPGTTTATGKVNVELAYKVGKKSRTKTLSRRDQGRQVQRHAEALGGRRAGRRPSSSVTVSATGTAVGQEDGVRQAVSASRRCRRSCAASSTSLWRHSGGAVDAGDQARPVDAAEVAVDERVARLGLVRGALGQPEVPELVVLPRVLLEVGVLVGGLRLHVAPARSRARTGARRSAARRAPRPSG